MPKAAKAIDLGLEHELCHPRAHLKACLLILLAARPAHGYELCESVRPFGYEREDPGPIYRALRWLQEADLLQADWETGGGPARRVFSVTPEGARLAEACTRSMRAKGEALQHHLSQTGPDPSSPPVSRIFEVLIEAKLSVTAEDAESASRAVASALADERPIADGIRAAGQVWVYEATDVTPE